MERGGEGREEIKERIKERRVRLTNDVGEVVGSVEVRSVPNFSIFAHYSE